MRSSMNLLWLIAHLIHPSLVVGTPRWFYVGQLVSNIRNNGIKEFIKDQFDIWQYRSAWEDIWGQK